MNEQNRFSNNPLPKAEKSSNETGKINPEKKLAILLKEKKLSREILIEESLKIGIEVTDLGYGILGRIKMRKDFSDYCNEQIEKNKEFSAEEDIEEILFSFLEKIQQQPKKIEEEVQPAVAPVAPISSPEEPSQPVAPIAPIPEPEQAPAEPIKISTVPENLPVAPEQEQMPASSVEVIPKPEKRNWWEVKRETEVMVVEDLAGDIRLFEKHMTELGIAKKDMNGRWIWKGGTKKLVFLGDILGDFYQEGVPITNSIFDLADQAEKAGGKVDMLCGNHDMEFIGFLSGMFSEEVVKENSHHFLIGNNPGIWEIVDFDSNPNSELKLLRKSILSNGDMFEYGKNKKQLEKIAIKFYSHIPKIRENMTRTREGKKFLENLCRIKLVTVCDDSLFCHADPNFEMFQDLISNDSISQRADDINRIFQENIKGALFENKKPDKSYSELETIYGGNNRNYFTEQFQETYFFDIIKELEKSGIVNVDKNVTYDEFKDRRYIKDSLYRMFKLKRGKDSDIRKALNSLQKNGFFPDDRLKSSLHEILKLRDRNRSKFEEAADVFLNQTENILVELLRKRGINAIFHGHSPVENRLFERNDFLIISPHSQFKGYDQFESKVRPSNDDNVSKEKSGIAIIRKNGRIDFANISFRESHP